MPARKRTPGLHVRKHARTGKLQSPRSPSDPAAWYLREEDGSCPSGTHVARRYSDYKNPKRFCVRNCNKWNPKRLRGRGGTCYQKTPWMELCGAMREMYVPIIEANGFTGDAKRQLMRVIMADASLIYKSLFPNGSPTIEEYRSDYMRIRALINRFTKEFQEGIKTWTPEA